MAVFIWHAYENFLKDYPLVSSAAQVAILGTFGELLGSKIRGKGWFPFNFLQVILKALVWAFLGITFKLAFTGFFGFVRGLGSQGLLAIVWRKPPLGGFFSLGFYKYPFRASYDVFSQVG